MQILSTIKHKFVSSGSKCPSPRKFPHDGMESFFVHLEVSFNSGAQVLDLLVVCFGGSLDYTGAPCACWIPGTGGIEKGKIYSSWFFFT